MVQTICSKHLIHRNQKGTTHWRICRSCRLQGNISLGNPRITSKMRPKIFHRTDTRSSSRFEIPLPHECTRIGETQIAVARVPREEVHLTKCVPLVSTNTVCQEKGWYDADVHRLPLVEQDDYQELIPNPSYRWLVRSGGRIQNIFQYWSTIWVPSGMDSRWGYSQNRLSYKVWGLHVCSNVVRVDQCTCKLYVYDEQYI